MNLELDPHRKLNNKKRLAPLAGFMSLAIGITGCGGGSTTSKTSSSTKTEVTAPPTTMGNESTTSTTHPQETTTTTNTQQAAAGIILRPMMKDCGDTAETACYMPITEGYQSGTQAILVIENQTAPPSPNPFQIVWPRETSTGQNSDPVSVECYVTDGQSTAPPMGGQASTDWYEIAVPVSKITNHYVKSELEQPGSTQTPPIKSFEYNGVESVNGWAPIVYFNQLTPAPNVPACK